MWVFYLIFNNFGWALIWFTLVVKAASFPLNLKQQKNMAVSQLFTPRVQEIQKKYRGNQAKMQEEMAKLQKEGYNPMGGCGPIFLTFIILFGVLDVVYKPLTHLERIGEAATDVKQISRDIEYTALVMGSEEDKEVLLEMTKDKSLIFVSEGKNKVAHGSDWKSTPSDTVKKEDRILYGEFINANFTDITSDNSRLSTQVKNEIKMIESKYKALQGELYAVQIYSKYNDAFQTERLLPETYNKLDNLKGNMFFLGMDLGKVPKLEWDILIIIPIISFIFSMAQMIISQIIQKKTMPDISKQGGMGMKAMMYMAPLLSLFIVFTVPAGAGFYWAVSYLFGIAQSIITYKFWPPDKMREQAQQKMKEKSIVYNTTATVTDTDDSGNLVTKQERLSDLSGKEQKEYYRKKLEEARRLDLEKYGDVPDNFDLDEIAAARQKNDESGIVSEENQDL